MGIILKWMFKKECERRGTNLCDWGWGLVIGFCGNDDGLLCSKKTRGSFRLDQELLLSEKSSMELGLLTFQNSRLVHDSRGGLQATTIERSDHYAMRAPGATVTIMEGMQEWPMLLAT